MASTTLPPLTKLDPVEAWQPWRPDSQHPWNLKWAAHLYRRAAFGAPAFKTDATAWESLQAAVSAGLDASLEQLFKGGPGQAEFDSMMDSLGPKIGASPRFDFQPNTGLDEIQGWWVYRMAFTPHPLQERMTLFWHNHFATSVAKVKKSTLMLKQNQLMRRHAFGKFGPLLLLMSKDPAMMIWLDSNSNKKSSPNENYAREVMELFSLGVGNYTEKDIREAARAFTGWHVAGDTYLFNPAQHDAGEKTILKQTAKWNGQDVVHLLLEQPAAGRFLAKKLYRYFISENESPPDALIEPLAEQLRKTAYDIGQTVQTLLRSRLFFSQHAYRQRIKSPAEFVIGLGRMLDVPIDPSVFAKTMGDMGQKLFSPPNVKGWDGGKTWLNSGTVLARHNLAWDWVNSKPRTGPQFQAAPGVVVNQDENEGKPREPAGLPKGLEGKSQADQVALLLDLALQGDVPDGTRQKLIAFLKEGAPPKEPAKDPKKEGSPQAATPDKDMRLRETLHTILLLPEYQLA